MKEYNFLAFDIGATSGRAVLGTLKDAKFEMKEIHRFPNPMVELHGRFYWDIYHLYTSLIESLTICARQRIRLHSIGIDTWGVDFGYVALDGSLLGLPRAYRDPYTDGAPEDFFKRIPKEEVYKRTGIQVMPFNSLFQLFRAGQDSFIPQEVAEKILFIPDLLAYMLTERMVCEYTIASTSQLLNPETHKFDYKLLEAVGVSPTLMCPVVMPGTLIGRLSESIARKTGIGEIPVIAVFLHILGCEHSTRAPIAQTQVVALGKIRQIDRYLIRRVLYMLAQICHQLRRFREQAADGVGGRRTDGVILIVGLLPAGSLCHPALRAQVMLRGPQHPVVEQVILRHVQPPGHGFFPPGPRCW